MKRSERVGCLKVVDWPARDFKLWQARIIDDYSERWSPGTLKRRTETYGVWLSFLLGGPGLDYRILAEDRVTRARVAQFVERLSRNYSPFSARAKIADLFYTMRVMAPHQDWRWLGIVKKRLEKRLSRSPKRFPDAHVAYKKLFFALQKAKSRDDDKRAAREFRNILAITCLLVCPIRSDNFRTLTIGRSIIRVDSCYVISVEKNSVKNKRSITSQLPRALTRYLDFYIRRLRPRLGARTDDLWTSESGSGLSTASFWEMVVKTSERYLGTRLSAHDFRRIAATASGVGNTLAGGILGHSDSRVSERIYNYATAAGWCARLAKAIDSRRKYSIANL
jgi:integrase